MSETILLLIFLGIFMGIIVLVISLANKDAKRLGINAR